MANHYLEAMTEDQKREFIKDIRDYEGFPSDESLFETAMDEPAAICVNPDCKAMAENMEPDQDEGFCEECRENSVVSVLVLAGLI